MPAKPRLEQHHAIEISIKRLSPRIGSGLMLANLPKPDFSDALINVMANYEITTIHADSTARKLIDNSGLLKNFYDNAFTNHVPLRQNFRTTYGHLAVFLAYDSQAHTAWFVAESQNRVALANYYRDASSLGLKTLGILLVGSTARLNAIGWQNLHDLLTDKFISAHPGIQRVEVMSTLSGVRWRAPCLGLGVTVLNIKELPEIRELVEAAMGGEGGGEVTG
jgi:hypothetical protein